MWVIDKILEAIIKRFNYNFNNNDNKNLNKINKPQYFFNFIINIINDNIHFFKQLLQPLILEIGLTFNIEKVFIYGLINIVRKKCKNVIKILLRLLNKNQQKDSIKDNIIIQTFNVPPIRCIIFNY